MAVLWKIPPSGTALTEREIHIWRAALDLPSMNIQELNKTLSADEKMRAERLYLERDRKRFIARRAILRKMLGSYTGIEPSSLRFCYGNNGKPRLADTSCNGAIRFNMSRSEELALYGFTRDREMGVDIESIRDIPDIERIVARFFSSREYDAFRALPESKKREAFFNCWTRKEAFIKAIGNGLSHSLDKFDVSLVPGEPARLLRIEGDSKAASRWFIQELKPTFGFAAAFAVEGRRWRLRCWQWLS